MLFFIALMLQPQAGLASKYPGDAGLERDPDVLLYDDYELDDVSALQKKGWGAGKWERYALSADAFGGKKCLAKTSKAGENGTIMTYDLKKGEDALYHRVYYKMSEPAVTHRVMGIAGVAEGMPTWKAIGSAGVKPNGSDYFCVTLCGSGGNPFKPMFYPYYPDQKGPYGDNWDVLENFPVGRWFCLEFMVKLNTPGQRNGELRMWLDGKEVFTRGELRFRDVEKVKINLIFDQNYSSKAFDKDAVCWADNRVVARKYVGPLKAAK